MDTATMDPFAIAAERLERLAQLRSAQLLQDAEYEELRRRLLVEMRESITSPPMDADEQVRQVERVPTSSLPYGYLHSAVVEMLTATYLSAGDVPKQRVLRAMAEMAEQRALNPGDTAALANLVEVIFSVDQTSDMPVADSELLDTLTSLNEISAAIRDSVERSAAAKAIAETAQEATTRASKALKYERVQAPATKMPRSRFWRKFILKDVEGAFEGGAAAVGIFPAFAAVVAASISVVGAFGVVIGAGVRSAIAQVEE